MIIEDVIDVIISIGARPITTAGFVTPLFISAHNVYTDRYRIYNSSSAAVEDGFDANSEVVIALTQYFAQNFRPPQAVIGRRVTTGSTITITGNTQDTYSITIAIDTGTVKYTKTITYTKGGSDTTSLIADGLSALILADADIGTSIEATSTASTIPVTPKAGISLTFVGSETAEMTVTKDGLEDLTLTMTKITDVFTDFFFINCESRLDADILKLAGYAESNKKIYAVAKYDILVPDTAQTTDILSQLKALQYDQTLFQSVDSMAKDKELQECAAIGSMANLDPGSSTLFGKTLTGASVSDFSTTQEFAIESKNGNYYVYAAGVGFFFDGSMVSGQFFDTIRGALWLEARMEEDLFFLIKQKSDLGLKIPYDDSGIAMVSIVMRRRLDDAVRIGYLTSAPEYTIIPPDLDTISDVDKAARLLPNMQFEATLAGAFHKIIIRGYVSV